VILLFLYFWIEVHSHTHPFKSLLRPLPFSCTHLFLSAHIGIDDPIIKLCTKSNLQKLSFGPLFHIFSPAFSQPRSGALFYRTNLYFSTNWSIFTQLFSTSTSSQHFPLYRRWQNLGTFFSIILYPLTSSNFDEKFSK
jgi:hypothetical protein